MAEFPFRDEDFIQNTQQNKLLSMFGAFKKQESQKQQQESKISKIFNNVKGQVQQKTKNTISSIQNKGEEIQSAAENWQYFAIFFILGIFCMLLSLFYLPFIILMPAKFSSAFTLGSINILISLSVLKGPLKFFKSLLSKEKILFSLIYFLTIIGTLYFSIINKVYIYVIAFSLAQIISLIWLLASNFPGGVKGMKLISGKLFYCAGAIFRKIFGIKQKSILPF